MPNYGKYDGMDYKDRFKKRQTDYIDRVFSRSDGYDEVSIIRRNGDIDIDIPIHIFTTKSDGERKYVCHPSNPVYKGDIIDYVDGYKYLVVEQDNHSTVNVFGKCRRMEETISWKDSFGNVHTHSYYIITTGGVGMQDENNRVPLSDTRKQIWLQNNSETITIYQNQRFILGKIQPYKVTAIDNFTTVGVLKLTLESVEILIGKDDLANNIAYNGDVTVIPTPTTGVEFTKESLEIPLLLEDTVSVYEYIDESPIATTFTFRIDGIPSNAYTIVSTTGNSITIRCEKYFYTGTLVAISPTLVEYSIPLVLNSLF